MYCYHNKTTKQQTYRFYLIYNLAKSLQTDKQSLPLKDEQYEQHRQRMQQYLNKKTITLRKLLNEKKQLTRDDVEIFCQLLRSQINHTFNNSTKTQHSTMSSMAYQKTQLNVYQKSNIENELTNEDLVSMIIKLYNGADKNNMTYFVQEDKQKCNHLIKLIFQILFQAEIDNKIEQEKEIENEIEIEKDNKKAKDNEKKKKREIRSACIIKLLRYNKIYQHALSRYFTVSERKQIQKEIKLLKQL